MRNTNPSFVVRLRVRHIGTSTKTNAPPTALPHPSHTRTPSESAMNALPVPVQMTVDPECLAAAGNTANVRLFSAVNPLVLYQMTRCHECLAADVANVRLGTRVTPHMHRQCTGSCKCLATNVTPKLPLPSVSQHVLSEVTSLTERHAANVTRMRSLPCVNQHVSFQAGSTGKRLATGLTVLRPNFKWRLRL